MATSSTVTAQDTKAGAVTVQDLTYGYNLANNVTGITDVFNASRSQTFGYDDLQRLTSATGIYGAITYAYDATGNRTSRITDLSGVITTETHTISTTSSRLETVNNGSVTRAFTFDTAGNVITDNRGGGTVYNLVYGDDGRLKEINDGSTTLATYTYGASGRRLIRTAGGTTTHYQFGGGDKLIAETDGAGATQREYIWLGDIPLARIEGSTIYFIHVDHLTGPQKLTDTSKAIVWDGTFTPFGQAHAIAGSLTNNLRLPGQYHDAVASYHQNHRRDYDPSIGRYLQSDPIGLGGELNTYTYVNANPTNLVDPDGLESQRIVVPAPGFAWVWPGSRENKEWSKPTVYVLSPLLDRLMDIPLGKWGVGPSVNHLIGRKCDGGYFCHYAASDTSESGDGKIDSNERPLPETKIDEILEGSKPLPDTKGPTTQREKEGGLQGALKDFESLGPKEKKVHGDGIVSGKLPDGRTVVVRPNSTDGRSTLEIQGPGRRRLKIRYND